MFSVMFWQKIKKVNFFGKEWVEVVLIGDIFDDVYYQVVWDVEENGKEFIYFFDDLWIIEGQGIVGFEILEDCNESLDFVFCVIGGGGLVLGFGSYFYQLSLNIKIIGVELVGVLAMYELFKVGELVILEYIDSFVDGVVVCRVGDLIFKIVQQVVDDMVLVLEGKVCSIILQLYNEEGIVVELVGVLIVVVLDFYKEQIKGKNVVCILSGSNNDIICIEEIKECFLFYEGLKYYFIICFLQWVGVLCDFFNNVFGFNDDIIYFEYIKKYNWDFGLVLVGIQLQQWEDYNCLLECM